jgi:hypothetical protein
MVVERSNQASEAQKIEEQKQGSEGALGQHKRSLV